MTARFWLLDTAGRTCWTIGRTLHRAGLALCGLSGHLDAWADQYPDGGAIARRAGNPPNG